MTDTPRGSLPTPVVPGLTDLVVFARGGYATVYRAVQQSVGREVAVKVENRTLESERDQQRFLREARAAGRMSSHPHVVDLFDAGVTADQHPYLIMELCEGSYAERMRTSPLDAAEARDLGVKIADALADAHALGVLHRDVKPANILYSRFGEPALADFGLAVIAEGRDPSVTLEVLTPAYAAPEVFRHSPPSPAVDVYALCATLYALLQGKPPRWKGDRNPSLVTLLELFAEPIPDLPGVSPDLVEVLRLGMANDPAQRPSAEQLRDVLAALPLAPSVPGPYGRPTSGGTPVTGSGPRIYYSSAYVPPVSTTAPYPPHAQPVPSQTQPVPPPVAPVGQPPTSPTVPAPRRRRWLPWFFGGAGTVVLLAGFSLAAWFTTGRPDPAPTGSATPTATARPPATAFLKLGGSLPGCLIPLPASGRCPAEVECFGPVEIDGTRVYAERLSCTGRHTWESYAEGDLPAAVPAGDLDAVAADPNVQQVCNEITFRRVTLGMDVVGWRFQVLPPMPEEADGDRTYRCLAGRGPDGLTGPTLTN